MTKASADRAVLIKELEEARKARATLDPGAADRRVADAEQGYRNAVNRSQLHSFTAMVYGVDPIDVTEQQVHAVDAEHREEKQFGDVRSDARERHAAEARGQQGCGRGHQYEDEAPGRDDRGHARAAGENEQRERRVAANGQTCRGCGERGRADGDDGRRVDGDARYAHRGGGHRPRLPRVRRCIAPKAAAAGAPCHLRR